MRGSPDYRRDSRRFNARSRPSMPPHPQHAQRTTSSTLHPPHFTHQLLSHQPLAALLPSPPALDAAWAEVEAALPRGWHLLSLSDTTGEPWSLPTWRAMAGEYGPDSPYDASVGATPAAALRALAALLAEQPPRSRSHDYPSPLYTDATFDNSAARGRQEQINIEFGASRGGDRQCHPGFEARTKVWSRIKLLTSRNHVDRQEDPQP